MRRPTAVRLAKTGLILAGVYLLYVLVVFLIVPPLIKPRLENLVSEQIGRKVTIEAVKLNPLTLSATIRQLNVMEKDGAPFAGFETLYANAQCSSLFRWALTAREIRLVRPFATLKLLPGGTLNIDDIIQRFSQSKSAPPTEPEDDLPRLILYKLQVADGTVTISNQTGSEPVQDKFIPLSFTLHNLSTLQGRQGEFAFLGKGASGGEYRLEGQITVNPVRVQGRFASDGTELSELWRHVQERFALQVVRGTVSTAGEYKVEIADGVLNAAVQNGRFELTNFQLLEKGLEPILVSLPSVAVRGAAMDLQQREISVQQVDTLNGRIQSWLSPDGALKLQSLFVGDLERALKLLPTDKADKEASPAAGGRPWQVTINQVTAAGYEAVIEDRTLPKPARFTFGDIRVAVNGLSTRKNAKANVDLGLQINKAGSVKVAGVAGIDPLSAELTVDTDRVALKSLQPYAEVAVQASIEAGTSSSKGRIFYNGPEAEPQIRYEGGFSIDGLVITDRTKSKDFIKVPQVKSDGIVLGLLPNKLQVKTVTVDKPSAHITIDQDGTINVVQAFTPVPRSTAKGSQAESEDLLHRLVNFLILQFKGPMPLSLESARVSDFSTDFLDESVSPAYKTRLVISEATVKGLSSDPSAQAHFKVAGTINQQSTIMATGELNPMNALQYTHVNFTMKNFGLVPVSPYSGKFIGYKIAEGDLALALKYRVEKDQVDGDNVITINQLSLGDRVDSPDALKLPIALGVALLKDSEGRIRLQVPVKGNVEDPQFDFGTAIMSALTGTVEEVGKSPFAVLPETDGIKGEDLRLIPFGFGAYQLGDPATRKLDALSKVLRQRTSLVLGIQGNAERQKDWNALSTGSTAKKTAAGTAEEKKKDQAGEKGDQAVDEARLRQLAQSRALEVKTYLIEHGNLAADRVTVKSPVIRATDGETAVVELFLSVP